MSEATTGRLPQVWIEAPHDLEELGLIFGVEDIQYAVFGRRNDGSMGLSLFFRNDHLRYAITEIKPT